MNICIVISSIDKSLGGPSRSVPILAKGLAQVGVNTTILTRQSKNMNSHVLEDSDVKLISVSNHCSKSLLEKIIEEGQFDLIHLQNLWSPFLHIVAKIARKYKIPYIMTPRGTLEPWSLEQKKLKKYIALALYQKNDLQKASCELATSKMEANNIRNLGIKPPIAIIPNGIDVSEYVCRDMSLNSIKKQIVFLSRLHKKKGIELLIQAWKQIHQYYKDWSIVIAGNGEDSYIENLKRLISKFELQDSISIIPPVFSQNKIQLYYESSIFVLPTYSENFGMVIAEALSCGLPVITTNGTPWQCLEEEGIGWCIDLSIENLSKTISHAIELGQRKLYDMGQKGSIYISKNYHYTEVAKNNLKVYNWIVNQDSMPTYILQNV